MRHLASIFIFMFVATNSFCQSVDSSQLSYADRITAEKPLFIDYNYGSCWVNHKLKILIEATKSPDSLNVTIKKYLPVEYRLYKDNRKKSKSILQDYTKIENPFNFKFPVTGPNEYYSVKSEYLTDTSFKASRRLITNFLKDFEFSADRNKLETDGSAISGLYCNIQLASGNVAKKYWLEGWFRLEDEIKRRK